MQQRLQQIRNLILRGLNSPGIVSIGNFSGSHQDLFVPRDDEDRTPIDRLGINGRFGRARKFRQNNVRSAYAAHQGVPGMNAGIVADGVGPGSSRIDDPCGANVFFFPAQTVPQQRADGAPIANLHVQDLCVVARHRARRDSLHQPLRNQALGKLTLCVIKTKDRKTFPRIQQTLEFVLLRARVIKQAVPSGPFFDTAITPARTASALRRL